MEVVRSIESAFTNRLSPLTIDIPGARLRGSGVIQPPESGSRLWWESLRIVVLDHVLNKRIICPHINTT